MINDIPMSKLLNFNDLNFQPHRGADDAVQARLDRKDLGLD